jgi:hypothetical protein
MYFQKGMPLLFGGQEVSEPHRPDLFGKDPVNWDAGEDLSDLMKTLAQIKRHPLMTDSAYCVQARPADVLTATHEKDGKRLVGIFFVGESRSVQVDIPDGQYRDLVSGKVISVVGGILSTDGEPCVLAI